MHAKKFQVRANIMIKKKSVKKFVATTKSNNIHFSHLLFFVAIGCSNKKRLPKCCPTIKKTFLFRNFFSKSLSNVSRDFGHRGANFGTYYVFAGKNM